jgi:sterol desaturase/sphingolipid hydroxylase (fatty acid hydroxylase superfamily)
MFSHVEPWHFCVAIGFCAIFAGFLEALFPARAQGAQQFTRIFVNLTLTVISALMQLAFVAFVPMLKEAMLPASFGFFQYWNSPPWLEFITVLLAATLLLYFIHRAMHCWPALWRFHCVHHCDHELDVSTGFRHHPVEVVVAMVALTPLYLLAGAQTAVLIAVQTTLIIGEIFTHGNIKVRNAFANPIAWLFVTPHLHSLHHSSIRRETDSNFGQVFSFWDRLFGTFVSKPASENGQITIGIDDIDAANAQNLVQQLLPKAQ